MKKGGSMKNLFKPEMVKSFIIVLTLLLVIKLLWLVVQITLLTAVDIDQEKDKSSASLYYRLKLTNKAPAPQKVISKPTKIVGSIKEITLLAIYNASDISVVTVLYKQKSKVLSTGDVLNGFTLEGAGGNFAMFSKDSKNYKVLLDKKNLKNNSISIAKPNLNVTKENTEPLGEVTNEGSAKIIDRALLDHYAENMDDIYKNIGIKEIKEGKDLKGFKIDFVKSNSPFSKLGIQRHDVIKSINGKEITNYNAAFGVYKNIKSAENLSLIIMRGNEEMELEYEIN